METIAAKMKVNKEQVYQQIHQLKQRVDQLINEITVSFINRTYEGRSPTVQLNSYPKVQLKSMLFYIARVH